jgi:signal transduction histidine kinase
MPDPSRRAPLLASAIIAIAAVLMTVSLREAVRWYGHAFAEVLVTSDGSVSSIGMPTWSGIEQGLRFPDRVESIDGESTLGPRSEFRTVVWDRRIDEAAETGRPAVSVLVTNGGRARAVRLPVSHLDPASWWIYAGTFWFCSGLYTLAALLALQTSPGGKLARAFAKFALSSALFLVTFFDMHTTRTMVPLFHAAFALVPFTCVSLALRLPDDAPMVGSHPWLPRALDLAGLGFALVIVARDVASMPVTTSQMACSMLLGGAMLLFVIVLGVRLARATGTRRRTLRILFHAIATPYAIVGGGTLMASVSSRGAVAAFFGMPALALAPIGTAVAFARYDLWGSRAVLSRVLTRSTAGTIACVFAVGVGAAFCASVGIPFRSALVAAAAGALVATPLLYFVLALVERRFFPARTEYKPTVEQLSEALTTIKAPGEVAQAVERTVRRWLPCETVQFTAADGPQEDIPSLGAREGQDGRVIAVRFGGRALGSLYVDGKEGGALFTSDDMDLLRTIANQAALALAHAHSYAELERRRQQQVAAWQVERAALVETVAAEVAHEVRYPINFFRSVFQRPPENTQLESEEVDIGREEVDRLERLVSGLRRMVGPRTERRVVQLSDLVDRVEVLLRDVLRERTLQRELPGNVGMRCDADQITQVLVNLVSNALDAAGPSGRVGVRWTFDEAGGDLVVWDDGPGFVGDASRLFAAWFTTKARGTGLGLAITQRIVRAHGWRVDALRVEGRTEFVVGVAAMDIVGTQDAQASAPRQRRGVAGRAIGS